MSRDSSGTPTTVQATDLNPRNPLGCSYALIPERLCCLPGGELLVLSWTLDARRATACLGYLLRELGACTGLCGRTVREALRWQGATKRSVDAPGRAQRGAKRRAGKALRGAHGGAIRPRSNAEQGDPARMQRPSNAARVHSAGRMAW